MDDNSHGIESEGILEPTPIDEKKAEELIQDSIVTAISSPSPVRITLFNFGKESKEGFVRNPQGDGKTTPSYFTLPKDKLLVVGLRVIHKSGFESANFIDEEPEEGYTIIVKKRIYPTNSDSLKFERDQTFEKRSMGQTLEEWHVLKS